MHAAAGDGHGAGPPTVGEDAFINDDAAGDSGGDDDDDDEKPKTDKKAGRRKIKIEFIQDKSRRHITFSKRKAGIMKKAYELSTLTGTQVLLLVVSETGLVYTFTTAKLQPLVTQPEGKNLIQDSSTTPASIPPTCPSLAATRTRPAAVLPPRAAQASRPHSVALPLQPPPSTAIGPPNSPKSVRAATTDVDSFCVLFSRMDLVYFFFTYAFSFDKNLYPNSPLLRSNFCVISFLDESYRYRRSGQLIQEPRVSV
ncbi:Serum response factor like protein [Termitomyces sp. J132]|nr:Serum response factor like protein [Termitomyces sp. J132]